MGCFRVSCNPHLIRTYWPGVAGTNRIFPVPLFSHFCRIIKILVTYFSITFMFEPSCGDTWRTWMRFKWYNRYLRKFLNVTGWEISERSRSDPHYVSSFIRVTRLHRSAGQFSGIRHGACTIPVAYVNNTYMTRNFYRIFSCHYNDTTWASRRHRLIDCLFRNLFSLKTKKCDTTPVWEESIGGFSETKGSNAVTAMMSSLR